MNDTATLPSMAQYFASGVFTLDREDAGFDELKAIAQQWSDDPCFHELIVRKVSEQDFGIQFVYIAKAEHHKTFSDFERELERRFSRVKGMDVHDRTTSDDSENIMDGVIVLKSL